MVLIFFEAITGLKINVGKSEIVPVGDGGDLNGLARILCCKVGTLPMRYLGMPLGAHCKDSSIWNPIIEKMEKWLAGWKRLYLLKGGRFILLKSTLLSLPTYFLSLFTRGVRGAHGCGMWRSIKEGIEKFFSQILYNVGEGSRVSFWHDPWCGSTPLKELFPSIYDCFVSKEAWISDLIVSNSEGGRSWNLLFCHGP